MIRARLALVPVLMILSSLAIGSWIIYTRVASGKPLDGMRLSGHV